MVMVVKPLFTLENATFWSFWLRAGLPPQPFIFLVWNIGSCVLSSSRATKWPPFELILSISKFPYIRYIRLYGVYTVIYGIYTVYGNPINGMGQFYTYITHTYTHMHTHRRTRTRTHTYIQIHTYKTMHTHMHIHTQQHVHMHICHRSGWRKLADGGYEGTHASTQATSALISY